MSYDCIQISANIKQWGRELGFELVGISPANCAAATANYREWLARNYQGDMEFMAKNSAQRANPELLLPELRSVISCALNYKQPSSSSHISSYALGRDYHKVLKTRLQKLAAKINAEIPGQQERCFVDTAPVFEKQFALQAGIGWQGKNSLIVNPRHGSWLFLGTIYTSLELIPDQPCKNYCGSCTRCIDNCPTKALVAPQVMDARRCIAYLTIEHKGPLPLELRPLIGTRAYGCDGCQQACPWNRFAKPTALTELLARNNLDTATLLELFSWTEPEFLTKLEGSAIRRIGYERWQRNLAVALGNAPADSKISFALKAKIKNSSPLLQEHIRWALDSLDTRP